MSNANRGSIFAIITAVTAITLLSLGGLTIWDIAVSDTKTKDMGERYAAEYALNTGHRVEQYCSDLNGLTFTNCVIEIVRSSRDQQRAEANLVSQQHMAQWAWAAVIVSLAGVAVTIIGIYYIAQTLKETRCATRAAIAAAAASEQTVRITRDIGERQLRPYIVYENASFKRWWYEDNKSGYLELDVSFRNCGQNPGILTAASRSVYLHDGSQKQEGASWRQLRTVIGPNQLERVRLEGPRIKLDGAIDWFTIGILVWYESMSGAQYEDHIWLTFDGSLRQDYHSNPNHTLYRPSFE